MAAKDFISRVVITAKDQTAGVFGAVRRNAGKLAAAVAGFFTFKLFKGGIDAAEELDLQMRKLNGTIAATGGAAGLTAQDIDAMARRLDEATLGSAAGFRSAANSLLTFKSIGKDSFETVLELAADLEAAGFGSLEANAKQLGRALEDPTQGLTMLRRAGVSFSDEQQRVIRTLVATGRAAEAQGIILEAVSGQVGGVARSAGTGIAGLRDLISKLSTDMREQFGSQILPVFERFTARLADFYKRLSSSGVVTRFGQIVAEAFDAAQDAVFKFLDTFDLDEIIRRIKDFADSSRTALEAWRSDLEKAGKVSRVVFGSIGTGLDTLKILFFGAAGVVAKFAQGVTAGFAKVLGAVSRVTGKFGEAADEIRMMSESFGESARINFDRAAQAMDRAADSGRELRSAFADLAGLSDDAADAMGKAGGAAGDMAEAVTLSADALDALGEGFEFVDGQARKAAGGIEAAGGAAGKAQGSLIAAAQASLELDEAYKALGITSQAALEEAAVNAQVNFERIKESAEATTRDVENAFRAYAAKAIAANDGVADAALRAQARALGLLVQSTDSGDEIEKRMTAGELAMKRLGDQAERTSGLIRGIGTEADVAARKLEEMAEKSARPFGGPSGFSTPLWGARSNEVGGMSGAVENELRRAASAVGSRR